MPRLLILGASRYYRETIAHLSRCGYETFVIDRDANALGFEAAHHHAVIDFSNSALVLNYARAQNIDGVMPLNDYGVPAAAAVNQALGKCGVLPKAAACASNKAAMRRIWQAHGLITPPFVVAAHYLDALKFVHTKKLTFPLIVKPTDSRGGGSRGVKVVETQNDLEDAFRFAQSFYHDPQVIIEECVKGSEHSLEVAICDGIVHILGISTKRKTPYPYRVDEQVIYPAILSEQDMRAIQVTVEQALSALEMTHGVAHIELAFTSHGPILFEIGLRPGGGATPLIIHQVYGIDYLKMYAQIVCGEKVILNKSYHSVAAAIYHFFILPTGLTCTRSLNITAFPEHQHIEDVELFTALGEKTRPVRIGPERHGFAFIKARDITEAEGIAKKLDGFIAEHFDAK